MPFGENARYDVVVDTPGGLRRIQVKSCNKADIRGRYRVNLQHGKSEMRAYTSNDCDVIAAYVTPLNHWFLVPVELVNTSHLDLALNYHDCLEAWHNIHESQ